MDNSQINYLIVAALAECIHDCAPVHQLQVHRLALQQCRVQAKVGEYCPARETVKSNIKSTSWKLEVQILNSLIPKLLIEA